MKCPEGGKWRSARRAVRVERPSTEHDLLTFTSSDDELTEYLRENALIDQERRTATTHLLITDEGGILGYFTLLNDAIRVEALAEKDSLIDHPYKSYPAVKIGRLSTRRGFERQGFGKWMLTLAVSYAFETNRYSGCRVITVDSKRGTEGFYGDFGFEVAAGRHGTTTPMYLALGGFAENEGGEDLPRSQRC